MTKRSLPFRTHYFSLAVCKHIFLHATHGLVFVGDAMRCREAERYGLSPLLLYALSIQDTVIRRMTFAPLNEPHAIYATLHRLWSKEAEGFRGLPNAVVLSRQVAAASPTLADRLASDRVELIVAEKGDRVSGAALRTAQQDSVSLGIFSNNRLRINSLDRLEEAAADQHRFDLKIHMGQYRQRQEQWASLPCRPVSAPSGVDGMDWSPGPWLVSWEVNLPPVSQPRYFFNDKEDRKTWLITGIDPLQDGSEEDESASDQEWAGDDDQTVVALAKDVVTCWPNSPAEIARSIGTTTREMKWFLDGKAGLDGRTLSKLLSILAIEWVDQGYEASGPCVLVAKNVYAATRMYDKLSHGGDLDFSYEAVPESGQTDPSWRYLLFQSCGGPPNIMMFERGSKEADRLNDKFFINFEGVRSVPRRLYRDVVATGARASHSPLANRREMRGFEERQAAV
jgi:hypothetical protein